MHPLQAVLEADADQIDRIRNSRPKAAGCGTSALLVEFPVFEPRVSASCLWSVGVCVAKGVDMSQDTRADFDGKSVVAKTGSLIEAPFKRC